MLHSFRFLRRIFSDGDTLKLGRWCHPVSTRYEGKCDQMLKMSLANMDSCMGFPRRRMQTSQVSTRDPVSVLVADGFGM